VLSHILSYLSGLVTLPLLGRVFSSVFAEMRQRWQSAKAGRRVVAQQLDPLLKAADELYGKLRSLAEEDFREFHDLPPTALSDQQLVDVCATLYLFAKFWSRLETLRRESFHAELSAIKQGAALVKFLHSLESRRVRLVDRAWQRGIAELVTGQGARSDAINLTEFVERYEGGGIVRRWFGPLESMLRASAAGQRRDRRRIRQRILRYGVVVHAFIDTLDPKHRTTRDRPAYSNKLSRRSKRDLIGRVFDIYLPMVTGAQIRKYTGVDR
jgi:hypothetical protein